MLILVLVFFCIFHYVPVESTSIFVSSFSGLCPRPHRRSVPGPRCGTSVSRPPSCPPNQIPGYAPGLGLASWSISDLLTYSPVCFCYCDFYISKSVFLRHFAVQVWLSSVYTMAHRNMSVSLRLYTTKIRTYKALVLSTLLYAAETWTVRAEDARIIESFHMKCQHQTLGIRWQEHLRHAEVKNLTDLPR